MVGWATRSRATFVAAVLAVVVAASVACAPPSRWPDGSVPQGPPVASNGVALADPSGATVWLCDLFGGQLLRIDTATGRVLDRVGPDRGIAPPDDVVVAPDGSLVYTSPQTGVVGRIRLDSGGPHIEVLAQLEVGVNPIALTPDGAAVVVGFGSGIADRVDRIDLATGHVDTVARGLPGLNGFGFGPDGALWAPLGGVPSAFSGDGAIVRVDVTTGEWRRIPVTFGGEPDRPGLRFPVSVKWTPDGRLLALEGVGAAVWQVDPATGAATIAARPPSDWGDNQVSTASGHTFVSGFFGSLFDVGPGGVVRRVPIGG